MTPTQRRDHFDRSRPLGRVRRRVVLATAAVGAATALAGCAQDSPASADDVAAAADAWGVSPDVVLTTGVEGFGPVPGGAGGFGDDGFSVILSNPEAAQQLVVTARPGEVSDESCADLPVAGLSGSVEAAVECTADGDGFYRTAGAGADYAFQRDDLVVQVGAGDDVDRDLLRRAADQVRVPTDADLEAMDPPEPAPGDGSPVERGDLPPGDGAPDNSVGLGG